MTRDLKNNRSLIIAMKSAKIILFPVWKLLFYSLEILGTVLTIIGAITVAHLLTSNTSLEIIPASNEAFLLIKYSFGFIVPFVSIIWIVTSIISGRIKRDYEIFQWNIEERNSLYYDD